MAWTYSGNPAASDRDWIRFKLGDTQTADQQLSDEEIDALLTDAGDEKWQALAEAVRAVLAKYARLVDNGQGNERNAYSKRLDHYEAMLRRLEVQRPSNAPYAGGISQADKNSAEDDSDRVEPFAFRGQFSNPPADEDDDD